MNIEKIKSHIYPKSIIRECLKYYLSENVEYSICKILFKNDNLEYKVNCLKDIDLFLNKDNNFYYEVNTFFDIDDTNASEFIYMSKTNNNYKIIEKIKELEIKWNTEYETKYIEAIKKIYNCISNQTKFNIKNIIDNKFAVNDISESKIKEQINKIILVNKDAILKFIGLSLFRICSLKESKRGVIINLSKGNEVKNFIMDNDRVNEHFFKNEKFIEDAYNKTTPFIEDFVNQYKNYCVKIVPSSICGDFLLNPAIIPLPDKMGFIITISGFENHSLLLVKKKFKIKYSNQKINFVIDESAIDDEFPFLTIENFDNDFDDEIFEIELSNYVINLWISNFSNKGFPYFLFSDRNKLVALDLIKSFREYIFKKREDYYGEKKWNVEDYIVIFK